MFPPEHRLWREGIGAGVAGPLPLKEDSRSSEHGEEAQPWSRLYPPDPTNIRRETPSRRARPSTNADLGRPTPVSSGSMRVILPTAADLAS
jgi:hypothetical protein